jgi:hypothetical protein
MEVVEEAFAWKTHSTTTRSGPRAHKSPVYGLSLNLRSAAWKLSRAEPGLPSCFEQFTAKVAEDKATRDATASQLVAGWLFVCSHHRSVNGIVAARQSLNATFSETV